MKYFLMLDNHTLKETLQRILIVSANLIKSLKKGTNLPTYRNLFWTRTRPLIKLIATLRNSQ